MKQRLCRRGAGGVTAGSLSFWRGPHGAPVMDFDYARCADLPRPCLPKGPGAVFSMAEVASHTTRESCYIVADGRCVEAWQYSCVCGFASRRRPELRRRAPVWRPCKERAVQPEA